jgi:hypothetical protein
VFHRLRPRVPSLPTAISLLALSIVLGGTAYAATGQLVNIADGTAAGNVAHVSSSGSLYTTGTASVSAPAKPFNLNALSFTDGVFTGQFAPTTATLALTGLRISNATPNPVTYNLYRYTATGGGCSSSGSSSFLGTWQVPAGQTVEEQVITPILIKPPAPGQAWCLGTLVSYLGGSTGHGLYANFNGYVYSGTFAAAAAPVAAGKASAEVPSR